MRGWGWVGQGGEACACMQPGRGCSSKHGGWVFPWGAAALLGLDEEWKGGVEQGAGGIIQQGGVCVCGGGGG
jgi:hypothetical protein